MSQSLRDAVSMHTDQHDANVIFLEVRQKKYKAGDNLYNEPKNKVSENLETSSASKQDKRRKKENERGKRPHFSSSSFICSSSFSSSTESENEIVEKMFKIFPKREEFKWNFHRTWKIHLYFKNCIPDRHQRKDIDEKSSSIKSTRGIRTG